MSGRGLVRLLGSGGSGEGLVTTFTVVNITLVFLSRVKARGGNSSGSHFTRTSYVGCSRCIRSLGRQLSSVVNGVSNINRYDIVVAVRGARRDICTRGGRGSRGKDSISRGDRCIVCSKRDNSSPLLVGRGVPNITNITIIYDNKSGILIHRGVVDYIYTLFGVPSDHISISGLGSRNNG